MNLYDLSDQYLTLEQMIEDDTDNEQLQVWLDGIAGKIEEKIESTVFVMKSIDATAKTIDDEIKRLTARKMVFTNKVEFLKKNIENNMNMVGVEKIQTALVTVSMQLNNYKVIVTDESLIPESFFITPAPKPQLVKSSVLDGWKQGMDIPGVEIVQDKSLRVR